MVKELDDYINRLIEGLGVRGVSVEGAGEGERGGARRVNLRMERSIDRETINRAVSSKDEHTTIMLLCLELEHQLAMFLSAYLDGETVEGNFNTLAQMLRACRFDNGIFEVVDGFRKLRNSFAHNKNASINNSKKIVSKILSVELKSLVGQSPKTVNGQAFGDMTELEKLVLYLHVATMFLASANQIYTFRRPFQAFVFQASSEAQS